MAFIRSTPVTGNHSARLGQSTRLSRYNFGKKVTLAQVRFDAAPMINLTNKVNGNFMSGNFYRALARANEQAATAVQNAMVESINKQVRERGRAQRPGQRLVTSIGHHKNREVFPNTFSVGLTKWLDQSPAALYYRQIEEGMSAFTPRGGILFTNNGGVGWSDYGPPYKKPNRGNRTDLRMPQFARRGVIVAKVGPYPAFHYVRAGRTALRNFPMRDTYIAELTAIGIPVTKDTFKNAGK